MGRRVFSREFKIEAVRLVRDRGVSVAQAARELALAVEIEFVLNLPSGRTVTAQAYFPELSNPKGILVFRTFEEYCEVRHETAELGY